MTDMEVKTVYVFFKDIYIGDMYYNTKTDTYSYTPKLDGKIQDDWYLVSNADKDAEWFKETIIDTRCIDPHRVTLRTVLNNLNMRELVPFEYMCKTYFQSSTDMYWGCLEKKPQNFWIFNPLSCICPEYKEKMKQIGQGKYQAPVNTEI